VVGNFGHLAEVLAPLHRCPSGGGVPRKYIASTDTGASTQKTLSAGRTTNNKATKLPFGGEKIHQLGTPTPKKTELWGETMKKMFFNYFYF